jgi:RNA polymerase sigma-70 factor (ECF subfamily)
MDERDAQARVDAALVDRAVRDGDPRIFEVLVRRHQGRVRAQLRRLLGHGAAMADDLAQDTFVLAWRKLHQFRGDSRFAAWLHCIAHSCFLQYVRSSGRHTPAAAQPDLADEDQTPSVETAVGPCELGLDLEAALQRLSTNQRTALLYCAQLGLSHEEAAELLDMPLGSVKTHVARGKAKLRLLLHDWAPDPQKKDCR